MGRGGSNAAGIGSHTDHPTALTSPLPASLRPQVQERLAKLSGGVAVLKVGGATETEVPVT